MDGNTSRPPTHHVWSHYDSNRTEGRVDLADNERSPYKAGKTQAGVRRFQTLVPVMHTSRVYSTRYSTSRVFFCLEIASVYSCRTREYAPTPRLIFQFGTVFEAPRHASWLLASLPPSPMSLDSPRARLAASCASLVGGIKKSAKSAESSDCSSTCGRKGGPQHNKSKRHAVIYDGQSERPKGTAG
jgi:hypothetical protein